MQEIDVVVDGLDAEVGSTGRRRGRPGIQREEPVSLLVHRSHRTSQHPAVGGDRRHQILAADSDRPVRRPSSENATTPPSTAEAGRRRPCRSGPICQPFVAGSGTSTPTPTTPVRGHARREPGLEIVAGRGILAPALVREDQIVLHDAGRLRVGHTDRAKGNKSPIRAQGIRELGAKLVCRRCPVGAHDLDWIVRHREYQVAPVRPFRYDRPAGSRRAGRIERDQGGGLSCREPRANRPPSPVGAMGDVADPAPRSSHGQLATAKCGAGRLWSRVGRWVSRWILTGSAWQSTMVSWRRARLLVQRRPGSRRALRWTSPLLQSRTQWRWTPASRASAKARRIRSPPRAGDVLRAPR